ncbi:hypothetical protein EYF80_054940 [Liparis tanakae]|uniref:Uncharacterized protein n=1 Tax=Liparis tanakae TaxID=230148 RepID=A0A4Z2F2A5_9TELE|nr:hypothetical protein EYF80_054940 [Liparis tanakae]
MNKDYNTEEGVADVNLRPVEPVAAAVCSVDDHDGGDDVGLQQVHSPPGVALFICVGAGSRPESRITVSIYGTGGISEDVVVAVRLGRPSTQGHVLCEGDVFDGVSDADLGSVESLGVTLSVGDLHGKHFVGYAQVQSPPGVGFTVFNVWLSSHIWLFRLVSSQLIATRCFDQRQRVSFSGSPVFPTAACHYVSTSRVAEQIKSHL